MFQKVAERERKKRRVEAEQKKILREKRGIELGTNKKGFLGTIQSYFNFGCGEGKQ